MVKVMVRYGTVVYTDIELDIAFKKTVERLTGVAEGSQILTAKGAWDGTLHIEDLNTLSIDADQLVTLAKKEAREENIRDTVSATATATAPATAAATTTPTTAAADDGDDGDLRYASEEVKSKVCIDPDKIFIRPMSMSLREYIESKSKQDNDGKLVIPDGFRYPLLALNALKVIYSMGLPTVTGICNLGHFLKNACDAIPIADKNIVAWSATKLTWPGIFYRDDFGCNNVHSCWDWWLITPAQRFKKELDQQKKKRASGGGGRAGKELSKQGKYYQSIVEDLQGLGFYTKNNFLENGEPRFDKPLNGSIMYDEEFVLKKKQPSRDLAFDFDWSTHGYALWKGSDEFKTLQLQLEPLFDEAHKISP